MDRDAPAAHPIIDLLRRRWSPRAFAPDPVPPATLATLFEAARWAPSSFNEQPWRFVVATSDDAEAFARILRCLVPANQEWARAAPVLAIACTAPRLARNGRENPHARHDLGLAVMALTVQATAMDLVVHQMAGIDAAVARTELGIPDDVEPVTAIAVGRIGDAATLQGRLREQELAPRVRRPISGSVHAGRFGSAPPWARP